MGLSVEIRKKLAGFTLDVRFESEGEIMALLGPSGCGKSMTLKCIAGIERPDSGRITLNGRTLFDSEKHVDLSPQKRRVGYLFQQYALFPNMTVEENLMAGVRGGTRAEKRAAAAEKLRAFRLEGLENVRPDRLSGGEQQRAALARILLNGPEVLLLDEPFSALDDYLKWQLELELSDTLRSFGGSVVYVSHSRDEVSRLCDTVCVLSRGRSDPKTSVRELFSAPGTVGAALISGCKNFSRVSRLDDRTVLCGDWGVKLRTAAVVPPEATFAGVRAHYLRFAAPGEENAVSCRVSRVIDNVFSTVVMLETPGGAPLRMELDKEAWAEKGNPETVTVAARPENVMLLTGEM